MLTSCILAWWTLNGIEGVYAPPRTLRLLRTSGEREAESVVERVWIEPALCQCAGVHYAVVGSAVSKL